RLRYTALRERRSGPCPRSRGSCVRGGHTTPCCGAGDRLRPPRGNTDPRVARCPGVTRVCCRCHRPGWAVLLIWHRAGRCLRLRCVCQLHPRPASLTLPAPTQAARSRPTCPSKAGSASISRPTITAGPDAAIGDPLVPGVGPAGVVDVVAVAPD